LAIASHWRNSARAAVALAGDLAAVGITANIRGYTEAVFWAPKDAGGGRRSSGVRARTSRQPARRTIATRETG
jgi:hypothetical protein